MNTLSFILLQAKTATPGSQNMWTGLLPLLLVFVVFYFFMIRPQMKRQKELTTFRSSIAKGDKVVTTGGIYGKVVEVADNYIIIDIANDVKVKVDKSAVLKDPTDTEKK